MLDKSKGFFSRLLEGLKDASVDYSLEAELHPIDKSWFSKEFVELEYTLYSRGHSNLEIEFERKLDLPVGEVVTLQIAGQKFKDFTIDGQKIDIRLVSKNGDTIPKISLGDTAEVIHNGTTILKGEFKRDN